MSWGEFASLLKGLNSESPLGRLISIRRENNKTILKDFTPDQHTARNAWRGRQRRKALEGSFATSQVDQFELFCMQSFQSQTR